MGAKYSSVSVTGYNASPPADDGSTSASNQVTWAKHKTKLGDPVKTAVEAINSALVTALDYSSRAISASDSTLASDNGKTIVISSTVTAAVTVSLMDAATAAAGYIVAIANESNVSCVIGRVTASDTISNRTSDYSLPPLSSVAFVVSPSGSGYTVKAKSPSDISVHAFGAVGDGVTDDSAAIQAADDYAAATGAIVKFGPFAYKVAAKVTKSLYTTWRGAPNSQYGVTANDATGTSGSRIVAGYNGTLVEIAAAGSEVFAGYAGIRGISFFNNPATYAAAKAVVVGGNNRQIVFGDMTVKGFLYGIYGSGGELYFNRIFSVHNKYGFFLFSVADSWFSDVHAGSGAQTAYAANGVGVYLTNCNNIFFDDGCRLQVQDEGPGCQIESSRGVHFNGSVFDQNDTYGVRILDSSDIDLTACEVMDNGKTTSTSFGVRIEAQGYAFTADASDLLTLTSGSATWAGGNTIVELTTTGTLPAGLATGTQYYVIAGNGSTTFKLAASLALARAGTAIDITDAGSGTHTIHAVTQRINMVGGRNQDRNEGAAAERQIRCVSFSKSAGGGKIRDVTLNGVDVTRIDTVIGGPGSCDSGLRILNCPGYPLVSADNGNAGKTLTIGQHEPTQYWNTTLTADRSVALTTASGCYEGAKWRIVRPAGGAFNLNVGTGPLKAMPAGSWAEFEHDGSAWFLSAYGTL